MVLGCNLGSALNPLIDAMGGDPAKLRVAGRQPRHPAGRLRARAAVPAPDRRLRSARRSRDPARLAALFHLVFNVALAALFIGPAAPARARCCGGLFPDRPRRATRRRRSISTTRRSRRPRSRSPTPPARCCAWRTSSSRCCAARRAPSAATTRAKMLDRSAARTTCSTGSTTDPALYRRDRPRRALRQGDRSASFATLALAINLEHIGDIVDKNLMEMAAKRIKDRAPAAARRASRASTRCTPGSASTSGSRSRSSCRATRRRRAGWSPRRRSSASSNARRRSATSPRCAPAAPDQIETSALQLDITRDLKRIEAHIAATVYGLLEHKGELRASRLTPNPG